jgi:hypothetical protein
MVLDDPMFQDFFAVERRTDEVDSRGRTTPTVREVFIDVGGVITMQSPADLLRRDDSQSVPMRIFIASRFKLRKASKEPNGVQYQPDVITWNGVKYTVTEVLPYQRYGEGFSEVIATSMNAMDRSQ